MHSFSKDTVKIWNNEPLSLHLKIGKEIRVVFPTNVLLQVPIPTTQVLQSLSPNKQMVYWTPIEAFEKARIIATSEDGMDVYIFDVTASEKGLAENIVIEDPRRVLSQQKAEPVIPQKELSDPPEIILTRYASQTLYAPDRLKPSNPDIHPAKTPDIPNNFPLMRSYSGESYAIEPVAQWEGYGHYVSAIMITNLSQIAVPVDGSRVRGNFSHITAQHLDLDKFGSFEDRTTLYLISNKPFQEAVLEDGYAY